MSTMGQVIRVLLVISLIGFIVHSQTVVPTPAALAKSSPQLSITNTNLNVEKDLLIAIDRDIVDAYGITNVSPAPLSSRTAGTMYVYRFSGSTESVTFTFTSSQATGEFDGTVSFDTSRAIASWN